MTTRESEDEKSYTAFDETCSGIRNLAALRDKRVADVNDLHIKGFITDKEKDEMNASLGSCFKSSK
jgi:hypothetical protein